MYMDAVHWDAVAAAIPGIVSSGAQLVQATRPPPVGTSPLTLPMQPAYVPQQQRSMFADPMVLGLIALAGVAVIILLMRR